jgi:hypothetical protein
MRYTSYRGLAQVSNWVKLKYAAMNLKKLAMWRWNDGLSTLPPPISTVFDLLMALFHSKNPVAA